MNKSEKIREHFRKFPGSSVAMVAAKYQASKPMTYKLRTQVRNELAHMNVPFSEVGPGLFIHETVGADETINERAVDYGKFKDGAALMQGMKRLVADHAATHDKTFADDQWEALEMILHKIGRIVNGNPDKVDSWVDIAGYATLVADRLQGNAR
jgi:hypothetical protein